MYGLDLLPLFRVDVGLPRPNTAPTAGGLIPGVCLRPRRVATRDRWLPFLARSRYIFQSLRKIHPYPYQALDSSKVRAILHLHQDW